MGGRRQGIALDSVPPRLNFCWRDLNSHGEWEGMISTKLTFIVILTAVGLLASSCENVKLGDVRDKEKDKTAEKSTEYRYAARPATPFFKRISDEAKPSRFLKRGVKVTWIEDDAESGFSKVRLKSKTVGYVPTRLLKRKENPEESEDNQESGDGEPDEEPEEPESAANKPIVPPGPRTVVEPGPRGNLNRRIKPHEIPSPRMEEIPLLPVE